MTRLAATKTSFRRLQTTFNNDRDKVNLGARTRRIMACERSDLPKLTEQRKIFYEENGFLLIERNVGDELIDEVKQRFLDICDDKAENKHVFITMKDPSLKNTGVKGEFLINKLQDFAYDEVLWKYISDPSVVDVVEALIGPNITAVHSMLINKPPNAKPESSLHPLHQDLHYFPFRPADKILAAWTAMERVDQNNGCLHVVPGSHKGPLYGHSYPEQNFKNALYHGIKETDNKPKHFVIMERGDTLFFHPLLLHGSGPNLTQGFRKAISCHYADTNCEFIDVTGTSQENIAREIERMANKLGGGAQMTVQDVWKAKSRLVRGKPGNFQTLSSHL